MTLQVKAKSSATVWGSDQSWRVRSQTSVMAAPTLPCRHSIRCPTVILDGMACGLMMMSGVIPSQVNGMSFNTAGDTHLAQGHPHSRFQLINFLTFITFNHRHRTTEDTFMSIYFLSVLDATGPLLSVAASKLVSDLWDPHGSNLQATGDGSMMWNFRCNYDTPKTFSIIV